jgi:enamine deaminase RidA (YjgF/YER057c/UK114 family)
MANEIVNPPELAPPSGFGYAVKCQGTLLFLAGATGQDRSGAIRAPGDLLGQFEDALANICTVVRAAGGRPQDVVKLTYFVRDRDDYLSKRKQLGDVYRKYFGKHYPAQSLFGVTSLWEEDALIEIEAIACIGEPAGSPLPEETTIRGA